MNIISTEQVLEATRQYLFGMGNPGFCVECGAEHDGIEPDAEDYVCESCGSPAVWGAEQLLFMCAVIEWASGGEK